MSEIHTFLSGIQIGAASGWDAVLGLVLLAGLFVYGFFLGRNRMIVLLLGSYFSWAIVGVIPWSRLVALQVEPSSSTKTFIFTGLICFFFFLMPRSVLSSPLRIRKKGEAAWWQLLLISVGQIGLLAMVILSFMSGEVINDLNFAARRIFTGEEARFVWITLPVLTILFLRRRAKFEK